MTQRFNRSSTAAAAAAVSVVLAAGACSSGSESAGVLEGAPVDPTVVSAVSNESSETVDGGSDVDERAVTGDEDAGSVADDIAPDDAPDGEPEGDEAATDGVTTDTTGPDGFQVIGDGAADADQRRNESPANHVRDGEVATGEIVAGSDDLFPDSIQVQVSGTGNSTADFAVNGEWGSLTGVAVMVAPVDAASAVSSRLLDETGRVLWESEITGNSAVPIDVDLDGVATLTLEVTGTEVPDGEAVFAIGAAEFSP